MPHTGSDVSLPWRWTFCRHSLGLPCVPEDAAAYFNSYVSLAVLSSMCFVKHNMAPETCKTRHIVMPWCTVLSVALIHKLWAQRGISQITALH